MSLLQSEEMKDEEKANPEIFFTNCKMNLNDRFHILWILVTVYSNLLPDIIRMTVNMCYCSASTILALSVVSENYLCFCLEDRPDWTHVFSLLRGWQALTRISCPKLVLSFSALMSSIVRNKHGQKPTCTLQYAVWIPSGSRAVQVTQLSVPIWQELWSWGINM